MPTQLIVLAAAGLVLGVLSFNAARARVRRSPGSRIKLLILGALSVGAGVTVAIWFPQRFRMNPESPAALLPYLFFWAIGGALTIAGLGVLFGAALQQGSHTGVEPRI